MTRTHALRRRRHPAGFAPSKQTRPGVRRQPGGFARGPTRRSTSHRFSSTAGATAVWAAGVATAPII
jgi:hypothetical protein